MAWSHQVEKILVSFDFRRLSQSYHVHKNLVKLQKKILAIHTFFLLSNKLFSIRLFAYKSLFDICILGAVHLLRNTI